MPSFRCEACGHPYSSTHNYEPCPHCAGLGKIPEKCTCSYFRTLVRINSISKVNPQCPIHGEKVSQSS